MRVEILHQLPSQHNEEPKLASISARHEDSS